MTKNEQNRVVAWRLKILRRPTTYRGVAQTCRHFGLSRQTFYKWRARYKSHGEAGLCDRPRTPPHSPRSTSRAVVSKILYLRERYLAAAAGARFWRQVPEAHAAAQPLASAVPGPDRVVDLHFGGHALDASRGE